MTKSDGPLQFKVEMPRLERWQRDITTQNSHSTRLLNGKQYVMTEHRDVKVSTRALSTAQISVWSRIKLTTYYSWFSLLPPGKLLDSPIKINIIILNGSDDGV
jgi:hypothetical protein